MSIIFPELFSRSKSSWSLEPSNFNDLPRNQKKEIERSAAALEVHLAQMIKIRATVLLDKCPWKFHGSEEIRKLKSTLFEEAVGRHLTACGLKFLTEEQQVKEYGTGTPDFLLDEPCRINGVLCHWIEVKGIYGCGFMEEMKSWSPSRKCIDQVQRYKKEFGPGALVITYGFGERFHERFCNGGTLLLDGSLFIDQSTTKERSLLPCSKQAKFSPKACPCGFQRHTDPPAHFSPIDKCYCCRYCRLSNGKRHGGHCAGTLA